MRCRKALRKGYCVGLLRQAAQYLLSAVYRLTVDRCEARIGRVWQPYDQVYVDIATSASISPSRSGASAIGVTTVSQDDGLVQSHDTSSLNSRLSYKRGDATSHGECLHLNDCIRKQSGTLGRLRFNSALRPETGPWFGHGRAAEFGAPKPSLALP